MRRWSVPLLLAITGCGTGDIGVSETAVDAATRSTDGAPGGGDSGLESNADASTPCTPIPGVVYTTLSTDGPITDRPAAMHADINIKLRGWTPTGGALGLVDINGPTDEIAPRIDSAFAPDRIPAFVANHRVNNWDWSQNGPAGPITESEVTLSTVETSAGEIIETPASGYDIGGGHTARVLYADDDSITIKYTREDNIVYGYAVHFIGVCVEPSLRARYEQLDVDGRAELPALAPNQPLGRARGDSIGIAIRDTGAFMDPRSRKDWWQ